MGPAPYTKDFETHMLYAIWRHQLESPQSVISPTSGIKVRILKPFSLSSSFSSVPSCNASIQQHSYSYLSIVPLGHHFEFLSIQLERSKANLKKGKKNQPKTTSHAFSHATLHVRSTNSCTARIFHASDICDATICQCHLANVATLLWPSMSPSSSQHSSTTTATTGFYLAYAIPKPPFLCWYSSCHSYNHLSTIVVVA